MVFVRVFWTSRNFRTVLPLTKLLRSAIKNPPKFSVRHGLRTVYCCCNLFGYFVKNIPSWFSPKHLIPVSVLRWVNSDFVQWDRDMVSAWLYELGLGYSVHNVRRWLQNGSDLVHASRKEIEQVCHPFHPVQPLKGWMLFVRTIFVIHCLFTNQVAHWKLS